VRAVLKALCTVEDRHRSPRPHGGPIEVKDMDFSKKYPSGLPVNEFLTGRGSVNNLLLITWSASFGRTYVRREEQRGR
jgi:hypothetical protein